MKDLLIIYERAKNEGGLSAEGLIRIAKDFVDHPLDVEKIKYDIDTWLKKSVTCYPDAASSITAWKKAGIPVIIITVGAPEFQKRKIELSKIPHDDVFIIDRINKKSETIRELVKKYGSPCLFIDDKATELDAIHDAGIHETIITCRILRKNSPYFGQKALHSHIEITALDDPLLVSYIHG